MGGAEARCSPSPGPIPGCLRQHISQGRETAQMFIKKPPIKVIGNFTFAALPGCLALNKASFTSPGSSLGCPQPLSPTPAGYPLWAQFTETPQCLASSPPLALSADLLFPNVKSLNEVTLTGGARGGSPIFPKCRCPWGDFGWTMDKCVFILIVIDLFSSCIYFNVH